MAEVVLFHHAAGTDPGRRCLRRRAAPGGHTVHTPDLFEGRTFGTLEEGMRYAQEIGVPDEVIRRGEQAVEDLPPGWCTAGFSLGVLPAQKAGADAAGRAGGVALSLFLRSGRGVRRLARRGACAGARYGRRPDLRRRRRHRRRRELVEQAKDAELFLYPGDQHYFADSSLPSYDAEATHPGDPAGPELPPLTEG